MDTRSPEARANADLIRWAALFEKRPHVFHLRKLEEAQRRVVELDVKEGLESVRTHDH